jgi:Tol biopolymer transport system component
MLTPDVLPDIGPEELRSRVLQRSGVLRRRRLVLRAAPVALVVMLAGLALTDGGPVRRVRTLPPADKIPSHVEEDSSPAGVDGSGAGQSASAGAGADPEAGQALGLGGAGSAPNRAVDGGPPFPYTSEPVYFIGPENDAGSVYVMKGDGSGRRQIPLPQRTAWKAVLSPDRTTLAYTALVAYAGARAIFVAGSDGSAPRMVALAPREHVQDVKWMPDGQSIVFTTWGKPRSASASVTDNNEIYRVTLDGDMTRLVAGASPAPSPDGALIAFRPFGEAGGPWVMNADGTGARQLAPSDLIAYQYAWSPDGRTLAFTEGRPELDAPSQLVLVDRDGGRRRVVLVDVSEPSWSSDGKAFVFTRQVRDEPCGGLLSSCGSFSSRIWTARADGTGARQLSAADAVGDEPQFPAHPLSR